MNNYKMTISYDGSNYRGWQKQKNSEITIQTSIENAISEILKEKIEVIGSGRTDKGVHAYGQVANFKTRQELNVAEFKTELNAKLNNDIVIINISKVDERFHSRYNAVSKTYIYRINNGELVNPFNRKYCYHLKDKLDIKKMRKASEDLIGKKDFVCFSSIKAGKKNTVKTVESIDIVKEGNDIVITIKGTSFLYNQVRIMVGTLVEIGLDKKDVHYIKEIFKNNDRVYAGRTIPPHGLYLGKVEY